MPLPSNYRLLVNPDLEAVWRLRRTVMYPGNPLSFVQLASDKDGIHWGIKKEAELVSTVSAFVDGKSLQFRKLATAVDEQGKGLASHLLEQVFAYASEQGLKEVWCNARQNAAALYRKFGMVDTGQPWTAHGYDYIIMKKES